MILTIANLLDTNQLTVIQEQLTSLSWEKGQKTAGKTAQAVKQNLQANLTSAVGINLENTFLTALKNHPVLQAAARPRQFSNLLVSRTKGSGHYGAHTDNAFMKSAKGPLRTDLSFTLFLSPPSTYDGGDLVIQYPGYEQSFKPQAGDLILYPSTQIHEVLPVTRGERMACVGWIESQIRRADHREILFDLTNLKVALSKTLPPQSLELLTLNRNISNLLRLWGNP